MPWVLVVLSAVGVWWEWRGRAAFLCGFVGAMCNVLCVLFVLCVLCVLCVRMRCVYCVAFVSQCRCREAVLYVLWVAVCAVWCTRDVLRVGVVRSVVLASLLFTECIAGCS